MEVISAVQKTIRRGMERDTMMLCLELIPQYERYLWERLLIISLEDIGIGNPDCHTQVRALRDSYFEFRENEKRSGSARLALANAVAIMCRSPKTRLADHLQCVCNRSFIEHGRAAAIPDCAFDKHTRKGKQMGRGVEHWLEEGCLLDNRAEVFDPYQDEAELNWKERWGGSSYPARKSEAPQIGSGKMAEPVQGSLFDDEE